MKTHKLMISGNSRAPKTRDVKSYRRCLLIKLTIIHHNIQSQDNRGNCEEQSKEDNRQMLIMRKNVVRAAFACFVLESGSLEKLFGLELTVYTQLSRNS